MRLFRTWWSRSIVGGVIALLGGGLGLGCCMFSGPAYQGPLTDHFNGYKFFNQPPRPAHGLSAFLRWQWQRQPGVWSNFIETPFGPPPPVRVDQGQLRVTFINHATLLVQMDGLNILTDPIWSERASPVSFAGPKRVRPPGLRFEDLPPIDVVVVSHNHYDHMDIATLQALAKVHHPHIFVGLGNQALLKREGIDHVTELDWWQSVAITPDFTVMSVPNQHFSNRGLCDQDQTLWTAYVLQGVSGPVYFAGDTGYGSHFRAVRERLGSMRLALLPIGAYLPRWFMAPVHMSPAEAIKAHLDLGAQTSVGMHFGTFRLADDGQDQPVQDLALALQHTPQVAEHFWVLGFGEGRMVPTSAGHSP